MFVALIGNIFNLIVVAKIGDGWQNVLFYNGCNFHHYHNIWVLGGLS
jgi:hypothetical protein